MTAQMLSSDRTLPLRSVMIIDNDRLYADAVRIVLEEAGVAKVIAEPDAEEALRKVRRDPPEVILLELERSDDLSVQLAGEVGSMDRPPKIIAFIRPPVALITGRKGNFDGFISKACDPDELAPEIERIMTGGMSPRLGAKRNGNDEDALAMMLKDRLSAREKEILGLLMNGRTSKEIAETVALTQNTVRTHIQSLLKKLGVHSRVEAAAFAARHRIIDISDR